METTAQIVNLKQFATILGVKPSYVTRLKHDGRLVITGGGLVDVEASKARIRETEGAHHAGVRERNQRRRDGTETSRPEGEHRDPLSKAYWDKREAAARAQIREMEMQQLVGTLVQTSDVRAAGEEAGAALRAALENLPDQLAPALVGINDEARIHAMLAEHVEIVLKEISGKLAGDQTAGSAA